MKTDAQLREEIASWDRNIATSRRMAEVHEKLALDAEQRMIRERSVASSYRVQVLQEEREIRSAHWELTTGHRAERHTNCEQQNCQFCEGGLTHCLRCGGFEVSLLPTCPGKQLTYDEHQANYAHYCAGTGPFAEVQA